MSTYAVLAATPLVLMISTLLLLMYVEGKGRSVPPRRHTPHWAARIIGAAAGLCIAYWVLS